MQMTDIMESKHKIMQQLIKLNIYKVIYILISNTKDFSFPKFQNFPTK